MAAPFLFGCKRAETPAVMVPDTSAAVATAGGFEGPEAVKYDAEQNVFFVSNFGAGGDSLDNNGFISRLRADGTIDSLRFIAGGSRGVTLHMPRGMTIHGDTLWVVDADAVRGFNRMTGAPLSTVDMSPHAPGFLNDIAVGGDRADRALYVTDTGARRVYRVRGGRGEIALEARNVPGPNGIAWYPRPPTHSSPGEFLLAPYESGRSIYRWRIDLPAQSGPSGGVRGGKYDGIEVIAWDSILVASQADSTIYLFNNAIGFPQIRVKGRPADIAWAPRHRLVAVPYISRDTVEFFRLP